MAQSAPLLRFVTYLAPSIPEALFARVTEIVAARLGEEAELRVDARSSGPPLDEPDPFASGQADFGFLCAPSYLRLASSLRLVGASPVFGDPRLAGRPVYFSDVIASRSSPELDPARARWAFNDAYSLSGYLNVLGRLDVRARDHYRATARCSGSHLKSIEWVASGVVDLAAIDSNVLWLRLRAQSELAQRIRVVDSIGPCAVQPIVARATLPQAIVEDARDALLAASGLESLGVVRFAPVGHADYAEDPSSKLLLRAG
jgi:phosphonate transport system substrate-binding protein